MARSQLKTRSVATPQTEPCTMAMTGAGKLLTARRARSNESEYGSGSCPCGSSEMSCPEDQTEAPGDARMTTTRIPACWKSVRAAVSSSIRASLKALRLAGWLKVKVPMASECSERMNIALLLSMTTYSDPTIAFNSHWQHASERWPVSQDQRITHVH